MFRSQYASPRACRGALYVRPCHAEAHAPLSTRSARSIGCRTHPPSEAAGLDLTKSLIHQLPVAPTLRFHHLLQNRIQIPRNPPLRIVALELCKIRDVTNMIALPRLVHVLPIQPPPRQRLDLP